jgi:iron(III) transport system substrate-binding protein
MWILEEESVQSSTWLTPGGRSGRGLRRITTALALIAVTALMLAACSGDSGNESAGTPEAEGSITVYSGRSENLIGPILADFAAETGIPVEVRYGDSADLALLIDEEGDRSPADVFISQSPGAVGFLAQEGSLAPISAENLNRVAKEFRNQDGQWVGMSGRVRVVVYDSNDQIADGLPASVFDLTQEKFRGKVGLAPSNGSFQDFVTGMREQHGDGVTQDWLNGMADNDARTYANNTSIVEAVGRSEVPTGLVNHYYNVRAKAENSQVTSENYFFPNKDIGSLLIATAIGVLTASENNTDAEQLVSFLLSDDAQEFFSKETSEYPLAKGVAAPSGVPPLDSLDVATMDLDELGGGLVRTLEMIEASGLQSP